MSSFLKRFLVKLLIFYAAATIGGWIFSWASNQFSFFNEVHMQISYIDESEQDPEVQEIADRIGIMLDPALEKHAVLIANRERLVLCPETIVFTQTEDGWVRGTVDRSRTVLSGNTLPEDPLYVYTGGFTADGYDVRMALIGMDTCLSAQAETPSFELVTEIRPESGLFPPGDRAFDGTLRGDFTWRHTNPYPDEEAGSQVFYLHAQGADIWLEKKGAYVTSEGKVPSLILGAPSGGRFGRPDLIQLWGTAVKTSDSADTSRVIFTLLRSETLWGELSFWYPDSLYP